MTITDHRTEQAEVDRAETGRGPAVRTAHDNLATIATMPWPHDPIPEMLARCEALVELLPMTEPVGPVADHILDVLRRDGRVLAEVDSFGMLVGPIRTRYLAVIAAVATA